ncbi:GNAT family N-acetyltransferase [Paenibacillus apii]|uniref:GNAT family N-acetyltransferase n=1 Tax=Paenibacillus apii TaxID=1850370 RepID=UPI00143C2727|nr:GNAT family protein [Paenibacillus apii]NJJ39851.1 GNAT family N-acetyltransferase [Paenibacillus apii]
MNNSLFSGQLVRLCSSRPEDAATLALWSEDAEYLRNLDTDFAMPASVESFVTSNNKSTNSMEFRLRTIEDNALIGFVALFNIEWNNQCGKMAIGIGNPNFRGRGYGTDALRLILRYGFCELNLHRIGLDVISNNKNAIHAYRKVGFQVEGTMRESVLRDGQKYDRILMSLLRNEYQK